MNNEQAMMNMMDWAIGRIARDKNINKDFREAVSPTCTDCGIDILAAGQEVKRIGKQTFCEDCWWERYHEAREYQEDMKKEESIMRQEMSQEVAG
jgi:predicted RNA-binding Zn-ribbon protein involved in translation (DUF1610 family)